MTEPIDFYFDFASPYSYFMAEKLDAVGREYGRDVVWRPLILWAVLKRQQAARIPVAVACAVAAIGSLLTGHPLMTDRPAMPVPVDRLAVQAFADARRQSLTIAGDTSAWLTLAEALEGGGNTVDAVRTLNDAIDKAPKTPDLWIGLGAALVLHADGAITPAARLAFATGEALAPRRFELSQIRRLACARRQESCAP